MTLAGTPRRFGSIARRVSTTVMVLAPGCLRTRRYTPRWPLIRTMSVWSAVLSSTVATSERRTGAGFWPAGRRIRSRSGRASATWVLAKTL